MAGVSPTTVSQALNNVAGARIAEPTRARIREIANELGYTPSRIARGLRLQRSNTIGLISDHIATTPYAGKIILWAQQAARERGWWLLLLSTEGDPDVEAHAAKQLLLHDVEGVLYATMYHRLVDLPDVLSSTATVLIDAEGADRTVPAVVPDEVGGGRAATHALVTAGHTRIGLATNIDDIPATHGRLKGYRAALAGGESATTPGRSSPPHRRRPVVTQRPSSCSIDPTARRRCSASTTAWRWAPTGPPPSSGCRSPATSRSSASTTRRSSLRDCRQCSPPSPCRTSRWGSGLSTV